jgi:hypothetical protein
MMGAVCGPFHCREGGDHRAERALSGDNAVGAVRMTRTLADLVPGESAYTSPAALLVASDRSYRIQTDALVCRALNSAATMHVTRTADGYMADITCCSHQWTPHALADCSPHVSGVNVIFGDEFLQ